MTTKKKATQRRKTGSKASAKARVGGARKAAARKGAGAVDPTRILARDVMRMDVLVLRPDDSIRTAAEQLEDLSVSGAPVVDAAGRLLGVLTVSDIARSEHVSDGGVETRSEPRASETLAGMVDEAGIDEEMFPTEDYEEGVLGRLRVADWMTPRVIHVGPDATIASVCRRMLDEAIHRVFVVDRKRLVGVVSTEDVVRLLAGPSPGRAKGRR